MQRNASLISFVLVAVVCAAALNVAAADGKLCCEPPRVPLIDLNCTAAGHMLLLMLLPYPTTASSRSQL
jgi:hypothetical protein